MNVKLLPIDASKAPRPSLGPFFARAHEIAASMVDGFEDPGVVYNCAIGGAHPLVGFGDGVAASTILSEHFANRVLTGPEIVETLGYLAAYHRSDT